MSCFVFGWEQLKYIDKYLEDFIPFNFLILMGCI
jgi:hypothetical protein